MASILSTKVLDSVSKNHFLNTGLGLVDYNAIDIELLPLRLNLSEKPFSHLVFSSKNGFRAFHQAYALLEKEQKNCWKRPVLCVGQTTAAQIAQEGFEVQAQFANAAELAAFLGSEKGMSLAYFKGNLSLPTIEEKLLSEQIAHRVFFSYQTVLSPKSFDRQFEGVLFFSPSGVQSHCGQNEISKTFAFCIGDTTAQAVSKYTDRIIIAPKPTTAQLILQVINHFKTSPYNT